MKTVFKSLVVVAVVVVALTSASAVFAQANNPGNSTGDTLGSAIGYGRRGGDQGYQLSETQDGILHDAIVAAFADALGLSVDDVNLRLADGETMSEIALSTGMTTDEFLTLLDEIHQEVLDRAVADGSMTQEQANWYLARSMQEFGMFGMNESRGMGQGLFNVNTGRGVNQGQSGTGDCIYND